MTPSLAEGCVDGVLRSMLLKHFEVVETAITQEELRSADCVFLTNTIQGIKAVSSINGVRYAVDPVNSIHKQYLELLSANIGKPFS